MSLFKLKNMLSITNSSLNLLFMYVAYAKHWNRYRITHIITNNYMAVRLC